MACRVCLVEEEFENNKFVSPCKCKGDTGIIHEKCLAKWIETSNRNECEICKTEYTKKEVMSVQLKKYCCNCFVCECNKFNMHLFMTNFVFTMFFLLSNEFEDIKLVSYIVLGITYVFSFSLMLKQSINQENPPLFTIDSMLIWKLSYTLSLTLAVIIYMLNNSSQCEELCMFIHKTTCNANCPLYSQSYSNVMKNAGKLLIFDYANLGIIIVLRSLVLCHKYNKKMVFTDYEETEPLLENV